MAETKPVKRAARKTTKRTTRRVVRKVAAPRPVVQPSSVLNLKVIAIAALVLAVTAVSSLYFGFNAEGSIDVAARLADKSNYVNADDLDDNARPAPVVAERPVLEAAAIEAVLPPEEPEEENASSTDETATSTESGTEEGEEGGSEESGEGDSENAEGEGESSEGDSAEETAEEPTAEAAEGEGGTEEAQPTG